MPTALPPSDPVLSPQEQAMTWRAICDPTLEHLQAMIEARLTFSPGQMKDLHSLLTKALCFFKTPVAPIIEALRQCGAPLESMELATFAQILGQNRTRWMATSDDREAMLGLLEGAVHATPLPSLVNGIKSNPAYSITNRLLTALYQCPTREVQESVVARIEAWHQTSVGASDLAFSLSRAAFEMGLPHHHSDGHDLNVSEQTDAGAEVCPGTLKYVRSLLAQWGVDLATTDDLDRDALTVYLARRATALKYNELCAPNAIADFLESDEAAERMALMERAIGAADFSRPIALESVRALVEAGWRLTDAQAQQMDALFRGAPALHAQAMELVMRERLEPAGPSGPRRRM